MNSPQRVSEEDVAGGLCGSLGAAAESPSEAPGRRPQRGLELRGHWEATCHGTGMPGAPPSIPLRKILPTLRGARAHGMGPWGSGHSDQCGGVPGSKNSVRGGQDDPQAQDWPPGRVQGGVLATWCSDRFNPPRPLLFVSPQSPLPGSPCLLSLPAPADMTPFSGSEAWPAGLLCPPSLTLVPASLSGFLGVGPPPHPRLLWTQGLGSLSSFPLGPLMLPPGSLPGLLCSASRPPCRAGAGLNCPLAASRRDDACSGQAIPKPGEQATGWEPRQASPGVSQP